MNAKKQNRQAASAASVKTGYEWERERPDITRLCQRCRPRIYPGDVTGNRLIVSPVGTAHWGDSGDTACGIDATSDLWWWPL